MPGVPPIDPADVSAGVAETPRVGMEDDAVYKAAPDHLDAFPPVGLRKDRALHVRSAERKTKTQCRHAGSSDATLGAKGHWFTGKSRSLVALLILWRTSGGTANDEFRAEDSS